MEFIAKINILPRKEILDPQGKAVNKIISQLIVNQIYDLRIGKRIELTINASDKINARTIVDDLCKKLLVNSITESYEIEIKELLN